MEEKSVSDMSRDELVAILITIDGAGRQAKREAIDELLEREFVKGWTKVAAENTEATRFLNRPNT